MIDNDTLEAAAKECELRARNWATYEGERDMQERAEAANICADAIRALATNASIEPASRGAAQGRITQDSGGGSSPADAGGLTRWDHAPGTMIADPSGYWVRFGDVESLLATKAAQPDAQTQSEIDKAWDKAIEAKGEAARLRSENAGLIAALKAVIESPTRCVVIADAALADCAIPAE